VEVPVVGDVRLEFEGPVTIVSTAEQIRRTVLYHEAAE
jgi:hypothetical protein